MSTNTGLYVSGQYLEALERSLMIMLEITKVKHKTYEFTNVQMANKISCGNHLLIFHFKSKRD
jgi:hypothetical protein